MADCLLEKSLQSVTTFHHSLTLFSSVGSGFSANDAHSLQDLIRIVQPLRLKVYKTSDLHAADRIGEGGTYRVFRCDYQRANAVAVKQVKLPPERSDSEEFRRHICSIKKDLEIMHHRPLANHPNIARLLGYGWGLLDDSALPFLVTELAQDGNLRQYLQAETSNVSPISRMKLTGQIATGLHALHLCGVAHGDLKLENVLIVRLPKEKCNSEGFVAQLSDFGQSCLLSSEQTRGSAQSYWGTRGYIAPELFGDDKAPIDFIKCDIWALALLVWETLIGGLRYFDNEKLMSLLQEKVLLSSDQQSSDTSNNEPDNESSHKPGYDIFTISDSLFPAACETVDFHFKQRKLRIEPMSQLMVKQIFRLSLAVDPSKRCGDVSRLPFTYSMHKPSNVTEMKRQPIVKIDGNNIWDFEMFRPENVVALPHSTKTQILSDLQSAALSSATAPPAYGDPILCLAIAYATGYGVKPNHSQCRKYTRISAENGSPVASWILACLEGVDKNGDVLKAFSDMTMSGGQHVNHEMCKFTHQTSEWVHLSSLNSTDSCNPLHYLSLIEKPYSDCSAIKRQLFGIVSKAESESRVKSLRQLIGRMEAAQLNGCTSSVHYIHPHFPLCLEGTPLSFAVHLGCHESVEALLLEGAHPLDPVMKLDIEDRTALTLQPKLALASALHTAVACHRPRMFEKLWSNLVSSESGPFCTPDKTQLYDLLIRRSWIGASIVSALAQQSLLERMLLHGSKRRAAQTEMIHTLLGAFEKATESICSRLGAGSHEAVNLVTKGVQGILALGELDIAGEIMATLSSNGPCSYHGIPKRLETQLRNDIVDDALRIACCGSFGPAESAKYIHFAKEIGLGTNVDVRATRMMMDWKASKVFRYYLDVGLDLQSVDGEGRNLLHHAITSGFHKHFPITELIDRQISVSGTDRAGNTPLHLAASLGLPDIVRQLLASNAAPMATNKQGHSILHRAVVSGKFEVVKDIINALESSRNPYGPSSQAGQRVDILYGNASGRIPSDGRSTLHLGVISQNLDIVNLLLDKGVDVNSLDAQGKVALHYALEISNYAQSIHFCDALISAGAQPLIMDETGNIPLHKAALRSHADPSTTMLTCFANYHSSIFDARDSIGRTILHQAVEYVADNCITTILKLGASPNAKNLLNQNALHICTLQAVPGLRQDLTIEEQKLIRIADILLNAGVDLFEKDSNDRTPMEYAAITGNEPLLCHLAKHVRRWRATAILSEFDVVYQNTLASAWSLAISHQQWTVLSGMFTIDPIFKPDMSLLNEELYRRLFTQMNNDLNDETSNALAPPPRRKTTTIKGLARLRSQDSEDRSRIPRDRWHKLIIEYNKFRTSKFRPHSGKYVIRDALNI